MNVLDFDEDEARILREISGKETREEQRLYWNHKSPAERLEGMWELNRRLAALRGLELDAPASKWIGQLIRRPKVGSLGSS